MTIAIKTENINVREALAGKVSLVTGSTSGIGLGIARALAAAGSEIVLNGFGKPDEIADVQAKIAADFKVRVTFSPADMSKPAAIREMINVKKPVIFDCVVDPAENCFPMIPSGRAHNEMLLGDAAVKIEDAVTEEGKVMV